MKRNFMNQPLARPLTPREKGIRTKYGTLFVLAALTALVLAVYSNKLEIEGSEQRIEIGKLKHHVDSLDNENTNLIITVNEYKSSDIDRLKTRVDSLHDENFIKSTIIGRYELTMDYLKEINPLVAKRVQRFLEHETE